jgi:hypothetical protein
MNHITKPTFRNPVDRDAADLRRQDHATAIHRLGPRPIAELLRDIAALTGAGPVIDEVVARYAGLDPALVRAFGADRFPPRPDPRLVRGRHG